MQKKCYSSLNKIVQVNNSYLYVGDEEAAKNVKVLQELKIRNVVSILPGFSAKYPAEIRQKVREGGRMRVRRTG